MRTWVPSDTFTRLQRLAKEKSEQMEEFVAVSDLVRAALLTYLRVEEEASELEAPPDFLDANGEAVSAPFSPDS